METQDVTLLLLFFSPIAITVIMELVYRWLFRGIHRDAIIGHRARVTGILVMFLGIFWYVVNASISVYQLVRSYMWTSDSISWVLALVVLSVVGGLLINKTSKEKLDPIPDGKKSEHFLVWMVYLMVYEFYFRVLLFPFGEFGLWSAISINVFFYVVAHLHRGKEAIAAIPYGIVVCLATYFTGNILAAFISHLTIVIMVQFIGRGLFTISGNNILKHHLNNES